MNRAQRRRQDRLRPIIGEKPGPPSLGFMLALADLLQAGILRCESCGRVFAPSDNDWIVNGEARIERDCIEVFCIGCLPS